MAAGEHGRTVAVTSRDEVGELARAFNAMAGELAEVDRLRRDFVANAAHELRTPLAALQINLQMLQREQHGEVHDRNVTLAAAAARRMSNLVETLLDASDRGGMELERQEIDLAELTREVAASFAPLALHARCVVSVSADQPVRGSWDPDRLQQAISNLLSNAFKYGAAKPVQIAVDQPDGMARLTVRDHGPGVTDEQTARMFEAFERGGPVRNYGGFGVGLYLTRRIVEAHGGTIQISAGPNGGATFQIELPRAG
jgi:signal transduction histidine kinase